MARQNQHKNVAFFFKSGINNKGMDDFSGKMEYGRSPMRKTLIPISLLIFSLLPILAWGEEVYKWVDEGGVLHLSDDLNQIPERFRGKVDKIIVPDSINEPVQPSEKIVPPSVTEPEKPKVAPLKPPSGFIPFNKFIYLTEGMSEAEVLSRFGPPTQEVKDEVEVKGYSTPGGMVRKETLVKRYYYIGDPDLGERTTVIHFKSGIVYRIERIFPPTW